MCQVVGGGLTTTPTVQINLQEQPRPGREFSRPSAVINSSSSSWLINNWHRPTRLVGRGLRRVDDEGRYNWTSLDSAHKKADWTKQEKRDPAKSEFPLFYQVRRKNSKTKFEHIQHWWRRCGQVVCASEMAAVTVAGVWLNCHVTGRSCVCVCELCLYACLLSERAFQYVCVSVLLSAANCSSSERLLRVHFNKGEHASCNWVASQLKQVVALG